MFDRGAAVRHAEESARAFVGDLFSIPLDLDALCAARGITVLRKELNDELSGMALIEGEQRFVIVNSKHHQNRQRFTIAHEVAHHVIHEAYLRTNIHVDKAVLRRDGLAAEGVEIKEIEANAFAAELLMPRKFMGSFANLDLSDDRAIRIVAKEFGVSQAAFTYRLMNLGLV